jgi:ABC-type Mn2+/Zn2+ transport system ATPase subunit
MCLYVIIKSLLSIESPLIVENGTFSWGDGPPVLRDVTIRVQKGTLVAVVGAVGSGKSSLLSAIIGDMNKQGGRVNAKARIKLNFIDALYHRLGIAATPRNSSFSSNRKT